jgi:hypothetical protein
LGKETLKTGSQLLSDLANKPDKVSAHDIITASAQNLVKRLRGAGRRGRKRKNKTEGPNRKYKKTKIRATIKRHFFLILISQDIFLLERGSQEHGCRW